jgi:hypothetical protein
LYTTIISVFGRLRQEDQKFQGSPDYIVRPCLNKTKEENLVIVTLMPWSVCLLKGKSCSFDPWLLATTLQGVALQGIAGFCSSLYFLLLPRMRRIRESQQLCKLHGLISIYVYSLSLPTSKKFSLPAM